MALKQEVDEIMNKAQRISRLILIRNLASINVEDNDDAPITITPSMKQGWQDRVQTLQADIKAITDTW